MTRKVTFELLVLIEPVLCPNNNPKIFMFLPSAALAVGMPALGFLTNKRQKSASGTALQKLPWNVGLS